MEAWWHSIPIELKKNAAQRIMCPKPTFRPPRPLCVLPVLCALRTPRLWEQQDAERANRRECQSMFCDVILLCAGAMLIIDRLPS
jgi:hypothetical protein